MPAINQHPTPAELEDFIAGKLSDAQSTVIEQHLDNCEACCQWLTHVPDNTLVAFLQADADTSIAPTAAGGQGRTAEEQSLDGLAALPAELRDHPRYDFKRLLGRGGMGEVYQAQHRLMNRPVAIKLINANFVKDEAAVARFHREVQTAARLSHPNIVTAYDAEQAGDRQFLVMEFVEGNSLEQMVHQRGPLPVAAACDYIRQAAAGLQHAHELGMVHRDIKPQNLMLSTAGEVKILDFGLAHFASDAVTDADHSLTQSGMAMGTPDYIAPEQIDDSHTADIRADIYSLGCTFYKLLAGHPPFGGSILKKIKAHADEEAPPLAESRDNVPPQVETIVRRMMAKNPADRFQHPQGVVEALNRIHDGEWPAVARPITSPARFKSLIAVGAALLLALVGIAALAIALTVQTPHGEILIEVDSSTGDDVSVVARGDGHFEVASAASGWKLSLVEGEYQLEAQGGDDQFELDKQVARITRGGKEIVRLTRKVPETIPTRGDYALAFRGAQQVELPWIYEGGLFTIEATASLGKVQGSDLISSVARATNSGIALGTWADGQWSATIVDNPGLAPPESFSGAVSDEPAKINRSYQLAAVFDGRELVLYVDGRRQKVTAVAREKPRPAHLPLTIGTNGDGVWRYWGAIDEIRISSVARYTENYTPQPRLETDENTLALYHFDEGAGDILHDSSRHRRHGKIQGAKWIRAKEVGGAAPASIVQLRNWIKNENDVNDGFAMSHDGRFVANSNWSSYVKVWDVSDIDDAKQVLDRGFLPIHAHMRPMAISPDGRFITVHGGQNTDKATGKKSDFLDLLDVASGETVRRFEGLPAPIGMATFTPDGKYLLTTSHETSWGPAVQWEVATGKKVREFDLPKRNQVQRIVVSPDSNYFAIHFERPRGEAPDISVWNLATGKIARQLPHKGAMSIDFLRDSRQVVTHSPTDGRLRIWNLETGDETHDAPMAVSGNLFVLPDARTALVIANHEQPGSNLHLVDLEMGRELDRVENDKHIAQYAAITPDGRHAITCGGWRWDSGTKVHLKEDDFQMYVWRLPERVWHKDATAEAAPDDDQVEKLNEEQQRPSHRSDKPTPPQPTDQPMSAR